MKHLLITSMIALGVGCGAAMAQTESTQPSGGDNCAAGQVDGQKGGKAGEQAQGKMKMKTEQNAQGKAKMKTNEQAQGQAGTSTEQQAQGKAKMKTEEQAQGQAGTKTQEQAQGTAKCQTGMANCPKGSKKNRVSYTEGWVALVKVVTVFFSYTVSPSFPYWRSSVPICEVILVMRPAR